MSEAHIKVLSKTEIVDGIKWRMLPKLVATDEKGRHWIPETRVVWCGGDNECVNRNCDHVYDGDSVFCAICGISRGEKTG